jgi:hypothetical protein
MGSEVTAIVNFCKRTFKIAKNTAIQHRLEFRLFDMIYTDTYLCCTHWKSRGHTDLAVIMLL